ncbi:MAG: tRNA dihydrouridine(20/20a) synthase DusA [Gammaproteobacteria bacterium]|nr:tRNA dihydrouridine(20/20a) synthase DusA [Gammaproteobacteria bacterium]
MMDRTDRHFRFFARLLSKSTLLYTEMVTASALLHGDRQRLLAFSEAEKPLALQLGGSDPGALAECAAMADEAGFDEVNLNVGCPSDRVQNGRFGACLMAEPELVAAGVAAMRAVTRLPITVKTRIGIDERDSYEEFLGFIDTVAGAGCQTFIVHARKAWLKGLSPKENREVPPLRYDVPARLKVERPELQVVLNGGIATLEQARAQLAVFDGVMIGRAAYRDPFLLATADQEIFGLSTPPITRETSIARWLPYVEQELQSGTSLHTMVRHVLGLFYGAPGGRRWRRYLSENATGRHTSASALIEAARLCSTTARLSTPETAR